MTFSAGVGSGPAVLGVAPLVASPPGQSGLGVVTVLNVKANWRLTFCGFPVRAVQTHLAAGFLFVLVYRVTSAAVLLFRHYRSTASSASEVLVVVPSFTLVTVLRFISLRLFVFGGHRR